MRKATAGTRLYRIPAQRRIASWDVKFHEFFDVKYFMKNFVKFSEIFKKFTNHDGLWVQGLQAV